MVGLLVGGGVVDEEDGVEEEVERERGSSGRGVMGSCTEAVGAGGMPAIPAGRP